MAALYSAAPGAWPALELLALLPLLPETSRRRVRCQVLPPGSSALQIIFLSSTSYTSALNWSMQNSGVFDPSQADKMLRCLSVSDSRTAPIQAMLKPGNSIRLPHVEACDTK